MKWLRVLSIVIAGSVCGLAVLWNVSASINGGDFRKYLLSNFAFLLVLSFLLLILGKAKLGFALWLTTSFKRWFASWIFLGALVPLFLFAADKLALLGVRERILFTLSPSSSNLLAGENSWDGFYILMGSAMLINAGTYALTSGLVWLFANRLRPALLEAEH